MTTPCTNHPDVQAVLAWAKETVDAQGLDFGILAEPRITFTESDLLREIAWVVLCSGFREKIVRRLFSRISICFLDWSSAAEIRSHAVMCVATALDVFRSKAKITAIAQSAAIIDESGFDTLCAEIVRNPIEALLRFPFIGNITAFHLAKNLGFNFPKPDRHLQRLCTKHGYSDVRDFCAAIAYATGDSVRNIDTLLWRVSEMGLADKINFPSLKAGRDLVVDF